MQKVYIVVPMYNAKSQIDNAIKSVLAQKQVEITLVLVDHGSKDGTLKYVQEKYSGYNKIVIIGLTRIPNEIRSASRPLNTGMKYVAENASESAWVMRLDSDDVLVDEYTISKVLENHKKENTFLSGSMIFIDTNQKIAQEYCQSSEYNTVKALRKGAAYAYPHHSTLVSIKLLKRILSKDGYCYCEKIGYGEDLDYTLRLLAECNEQQVYFSNVPMIIKELSGDTITNSVKFRTLMYDHYIIFTRNKCLSRVLYLRIVLWYLFENAGKIGKKINSLRTPPAGKYSISNVLDFKEINFMKEKWQN